MRALAPLLLLAVLPGCGTGTIRLDDTAAAAGDDTAADTDPGDTDTDPGDTDDTEPAASPWAGSYTGAFTLSVADPRGGGDPMVVCEGTADLTVDDAGALTGDGTCTTAGPGGDGGGGGGELTATFTAVVSEDGTVAGEVLQDSPGESEQQSWEVAGTVSEAGVNLAWTGEISDPMGNAMPFDGAVVTE